MRKIIMNLAISLDGYICDENGGFDWIVGHGDHKIDMNPYDFSKFLSNIDTLIMGSVSYKDVVLSNLTTFEDKEIFVATHQDLEKRNNATSISGNIVDQIVKLKEGDGKNIWLFGGAGLVDAFIRANAIDEYVIAVIPTILGNGRRLFKGNYPKLDLYLNEYAVSDGISVMTYSRRNS